LREGDEHSWIIEHVRGKRFDAIGGLLGTANEMVPTAVEAQCGLPRWSTCSPWKRVVGELRRLKSSLRVAQRLGGSIWSGLYLGDDTEPMRFVGFDYVLHITKSAENFLSLACRA
jgi:hypothetical protein